MHFLLISLRKSVSRRRCEIKPKYCKLSRPGKEESLIFPSSLYLLYLLYTTIQALEWNGMVMLSLNVYVYRKKNMNKI